MTSPGPLFDAPRRTHRESQILAYQRIRDGGLLSRMRFLVYETIYRNQGGDGMTSGEIDRAISSDLRTWTRSASPRLIELVRLDAIEELPELRPCRQTGMKVIAYRTTGRLPRPRLRRASSRRDRTYAAALLARLCPAYVRPELQSEFLERTRNLADGFGFVMDFERHGDA